MKFHRTAALMHQQAPSPAGLFFSRFDQRVLIIVWSTYLLFLVSIDKYDLMRILLFTSFPLFALIATQIPVKPLVLRLLTLSPFLLVMAAANPFFDRQIKGYLFNTIPISGGVLSAAGIFLKALLSLSSMLILEACISISGLCHALQRLGVPTVFTTQLLLMYRYCYLIFSEAATLMKARDMRSSDNKGKGPINTAYLIGTLLFRSTERSDRIFRAMLARGFNGMLPNDSFREHLDTPDWILLLLLPVFFVFLRFIL